MSDTQSRGESGLQEKWDRRRIQYAEEGKHVRAVLLGLILKVAGLFAGDNESKSASGMQSAESSQQSASAQPATPVPQTARNAASAPATAGGSAGRIGGPNSNANQAQPNKPPFSPYASLERNAGWLTLGTLAFVILAAAWFPIDQRWVLMGLATFVLAVVLLFTRTLDSQSDIDAIFRAAWCFVIAVAVFGVIFLFLGEEILNSLHPKSQSSTGNVGVTDTNGDRAASATDPDPAASATAALGPSIAKPKLPLCGASTAGDKACDAAQPIQLKGGRVLSTVDAASVTSVADASTAMAATENSKAASAATEGTVPKPAGNGPAKNDTAGSAGSKYSPYLFAIARGCDYYSIAYSNKVTVPQNTKSPAASAATPSPLNTQVVQAGMPEGVYCGEVPPQWVLVIGGNILDCSFDGTCPKPAVHPPADLKALQKALDDANEALTKEKAAKQQADDNAYAEELEEYAHLYDSSKPKASPTNVPPAAKIAELTKNAQSAKKDFDAAKVSVPKLAIEGAPIIGGVVIPVFFVVIAMMGALINMGRKLPEFQERVDPDYKKEFETKLSSADDVQAPISWAYARDMVVFQIIQVLSAPGIAILAYSWARPEDQANTVILAFAAGFTSEVFLLAVRGVVDRMIGLGPRPARTRAMLAASDSTPKTGLPPRGPVSPSSKTAGAFKVGDVVRLVAPVGPCMPGAVGIVSSVESAGDVVVTTTQDHTGAALNYRLQAQSPASFELVSGKGGTAARQAATPVG
jgi:hypothetical protein